MEVGYGCLSSHSSLAAGPVTPTPTCGENELQLKLRHFLGSENKVMVERTQALHKLCLSTLGVSRGAQ